MKRRVLLVGLVSAALLPVAAVAQPAGKTYRLGLLVVLPFPPLTDPFIEALRTHGWIVGRNIHIETRATARDHLRAPALARELVEQGADVLVTVTTANALAARRRMPTISDVAGLWFNAGGVLAYSADFKEFGARAASFVDRILRGARPADLPIELPTRFELVLNTKTAKALGLHIPQSILLRADRVIE